MSRLDAAELATIPSASAAFAARQRGRGFERLAIARRALAELADPHRLGAVDLDEVYGAIDARVDAYALIGEWTAHWRTP